MLPETLITATRATLAPYKAPRQLLRVDRVPRTPSAKADYPAARALFAEAELG